MPRRLYLEDLGKETDNKYLAVCIAITRARQLSEDERPTIDIDAVKKSTIALHELAEGELSYSYKEIEPPEEKIDVVREVSEDETEFDKIFKEEYVDDSDVEYDDTEPEEGL